MPQSPLKVFPFDGTIGVFGKVNIVVLYSDGMHMRITSFCALLVLVFCRTLNADPLPETTYHTVFHEVPKRTPRPWSVPDKIDVRIVDEQGKPVEKAKIQLIIGDGTQVLADLEAESDHDGKASLLIAGEHRKEILSAVSIEVSKGETHISYHFNWLDYGRMKGEKVVVPSELDVPLHRAEMVECLVLDEDGKPVEGVAVEATISRNKTFESGFYSYGWSSSCNAKTDAEGKWKVGPVPLGSGMKEVSRITFTHPDYVRKDVSCSFRDEPPLEVKQTIVRATSVHGRVVDHGGKPIEGATIYRDGYIKTKTDADGKYRIGGLGKEEFKLIAMAPVKAYSLQKIDPTKTQTVDFTLEPGKTIRLRAVTEDGKTLTNIHVFADLDGIAEYPFFDYLETKLHDDGTWEWTNAPDREISFGIYHRGNPRQSVRNYRKFGYYPKSPAVFRPDGETHIIPFEWVDETNGHPNLLWTLPEQFVVRVLDSRDGKPRKDASVVLVFGGGFFGMDERNETKYKTDENGLVGFDMAKVDREHVLAVSVFVKEDEIFLGGKKQWGSDPIRGNERSGPPFPELLEFLQIRKDAGLAGLVRDEVGKPLPGVTVRSAREEIAVKTDENGVWREGNASLGEHLVFELPGFLKYENRREVEQLVTMKQGKKVTGRVIDENGTPVSGAKVFVENTKECDWYKAETNEKGLFEHFIGTTCNGNNVKLFAMKTDKTPCTLEVDMTGSTENLEFTLTPGKPIRFRLVYENGDPVPPYTFRAGMFRAVRRTWEGGRCHYSDDYEIEWNSDIDGRIEWKNAPDFKTEYHFYPENDFFRLPRAQRYLPADEEQVLKVSNSP